MSVSRRRMFSIPLILSMSAVLGGCRSAGIKDAFTSRDSAGRLKTRTFRNDKTQIHLIVEFVSGREDAVLYVELFVPEGSLAKFDQIEIAPGKGTHRLDIKLMMEDENGNQELEGPWPPGAYEADLLIDGEYFRTVKFDIAG